MDQDETWHGGRPLLRPHCVRWRLSSPLQKRDTAPNFRPMSVVAKWLDGLMPFCMEVGLVPGDFVLDGDQAPPRQKGAQSPQFSAHIYCGHTAGWIKMQLGTEVGLGQGDIVEWGPSSPPPKKGGATPNFRLMSIVAKGLDGSRCNLVRRQASAHATLC